MPVGAQLSPLGVVRLPLTSLTSEPETESVNVKLSPCVTLVGMLVLVIDSEPAAKIGMANNKVTAIAVNKIFLFIRLT